MTDELLARDGGGSWIDPEVVFGKLTYRKWRTLPAVEQAAITDYTRTDVRKTGFLI
jgi:hypothetical protein